MLSQTEQVVDIGSHETTGSGETTNSIKIVEAWARTKIHVKQIIQGKCEGKCKRECNVLDNFCSSQQ